MFSLCPECQLARVSGRKASVNKKNQPQRFKFLAFISILQKYLQTETFMVSATEFFLLFDRTSEDYCLGDYCQSRRNYSHGIDGQSDLGKSLF